MVLNDCQILKPRSRKSVIFDPSTDHRSLYELFPHQGYPIPAGIPWKTDASILTKDSTWHWNANCWRTSSKDECVCYAQRKAATQETTVRTSEVLVPDWGCEQLYKSFACRDTHETASRSQNNPSCPWGFWFHFDWQWNYTYHAASWFYWEVC